MKATFRQRYPQYIPFYYIIFLMFRKLVRQSQLRCLEAVARKKTADLEFQDGLFHGAEANFSKNSTGIINKPAFWIDEDLNCPYLKELVDKINVLKKLLDSKGLRYCSPAGTFIPDTYHDVNAKSKIWENVWTIYHSKIQLKDTVLDLGGASTIFSFYLASLGHSVRVIDNDWGNCGTIYNTNYVGKQMNWDIKAYDCDLSKPLPFKDASFDRVFSICVVEHLSCESRRFMMQEVNRVLKPGGIVSLTFDYGSVRNCLLSDKGLRFAYREKIERDIINPSGLEVFGNKEWSDPFPRDSFLGALFLKK